MDDKSLLQIAAMGGVMGLGHVLSPDHLSALANHAGSTGVVLPAYMDPAEGSKENMTGLAIFASLLTVVIFLVTLLSKYLISVSYL